MIQALKMPQSILEWQDCFCGKLPTMSALRNAFTQLLRYCFSDPDHYSDLKDTLGCLKYDPNNGPGSINIYAKGSRDPANTDNIPGITISLNEGITYQMPSLQDWHVSSPDFSQTTSHTLGLVKLQISCSDYSSDIACAMTDATMMFIMGAKLKILQSWGRWIKDLRVVLITEPAQKQVSEQDSSVTWYEANVIVDIKIEYAVDTIQESKRLKASTINSHIDTYNHLM